MKQQITEIVNTAVSSLNLTDTPEVQIERARDKQYGDFACNIAMQLAKKLKTNPRELAQSIIDAMPASDLIKEVNIAGPGFINIFVQPSVYHQLLTQIIQTGSNFGRSDIGQGQKVHMEIVSSNPTGPIHVGHGRLAAYGATLANLLDAAGFKAHREYYVNDAGRQMDILATSVWMRYLELFGEHRTFPSNGYKGDYIKDIAKQLKVEHLEKFLQKIDAVYQDVPADEDESGNGDKEKHIDGLINNAKKLLGEADYQIIFKAALDAILADIHDDLAEFGVHYQQWFHESSLDIKAGIERMRTLGHLYEKDGATWFKSTEFGDDKDRVVIRENGQTTYFASDIAYHLDKYDRGFDLILDIFGADHHGYGPRLHALLKAAGENPDKLKVLLIQFAILWRGKEKVSMSTRGGSFVTLRELREEVGNDAARFFYILRKAEQHLDFDLELAKSQSSDNPVYYIQYAHARICSVLRQMEAKQIQWDQDNGCKNLALLTTEHEVDLTNQLSRYPEIIEMAAVNYEPHTLAHYLQDLANDMHSYYNAQKFLVDDDALRNARLCLIVATKTVIANGLKLLGVSAPEEM